MGQQIETDARDAVSVEDAATISMMGFSVIEAFPSRAAPYDLTDPFILVHEARSASPTWRAWTRGIPRSVTDEVTF